jgi:hypothetical protein
VSGSNLNPQNTSCIPAVKIFAFLELEQKSAFAKVSPHIFRVRRSAFKVVDAYGMLTLPNHEP